MEVFKGAHFHREMIFSVPLLGRYIASNVLWLKFNILLHLLLNQQAHASSNSEVMVCLERDGAVLFHLPCL